VRGECVDRSGQPEAASQDQLHDIRASGTDGEQTDFEFRVKLTSVAGREWVLVAAPTAAYFSERISGLATVVLVFSIGFVLLGAGYTTMILRRSIIIDGVVHERTQELEEAKARLARLAMTDGLLGIANRRCFDERLAHEWKRATREQTPITLLLLDIDHFKLFNDRYGHQAGDDCLKRVASALQKLFKRPADSLARFGGEEFAVILPNTSGIASLAESCRRAIEALEIKHGPSPVSDWVTISAGLATVGPAPGVSTADLVRAADQALYRAKKNGRNRLEFAGYPGIESPTDQRDAA